MTMMVMFVTLIIMMMSMMICMRLINISRQVLVPNPYLCLIIMMMMFIDYNDESDDDDFNPYPTLPYL